jgi:hypothetical protein
MGSAAATHPPLIYPWQQEPSLSETRSYPALAEMLGGHCSADGIDIPCGMAMSLLQNGAGRLCPNNDCWIQPIRKSPQRRPLPGLNPFAGPSVTERYGETAWAQHGNGTIAFSSRPNQFAGPSVTGHPAPSNYERATEDEIDKLRSAIADTLTDNACDKFVSETLSQLSNTGNSIFNTTNAVTIFNNVLAIGGIWKGDIGIERYVETPASVSRKGNGKVESFYVGIRINTTKPVFSSLGQSNPTPYMVAMRGTTLIHELMHAAGYGGYSHRDMAKAANLAALALGYDAVGNLPSKDSDSANSSYFDDFLWKACYRGPTGRR